VIPSTYLKSFANASSIPTEDLGLKGATFTSAMIREKLPLVSNLMEEDGSGAARSKGKRESKHIKSLS
jgi:hypothetical protein